jgi:hypothetical protein
MDPPPTEWFYRSLAAREGADSASEAEKFRLKVEDVVRDFRADIVREKEMELRGRGAKRALAAAVWRLEHPPVRRWWACPEEDFDAMTKGDLFEGVGFEEWWRGLEALWKERYRAFHGEDLPEGKMVFEEVCREARSQAEIIRAVSPHVRRSLWARVDAASRLQAERLLEALKVLSRRPFRFLDLPVDLRRCVYDYVDLEWIIESSRQRSKLRAAPALLHCCRTIRDELLPMMTLRMNFDPWPDEDFADKLLEFYRASGGAAFARPLKRTQVSFPTRRLGQSHDIIFSLNEGRLEYTSGVYQSRKRIRDLPGGIVLELEKLVGIAEARREKETLQGEILILAVVEHFAHFDYLLQPEHPEMRLRLWNWQHAP